MNGENGNFYSVGNIFMHKIDKILVVLKFTVMSTKLIRFMTKCDRPDDRKILIAYTFDPNISNDMTAIANEIVARFSWIFGVELDSMGEWDFNEKQPSLFGWNFRNAETYYADINKMIEYFKEHPYELLQRIEETNNPKTRNHPTCDAYTIAYNGNIKLDALQMLCVYDEAETPEQRASGSIIYDCGHGYKKTQ